MATLIHAAASHLWSSMLSPQDRVLVTGASGWFGRTACALVTASGAPLLALASSDKDVCVGDAVVRCVAWDADQVADFAPTAVIDCAFLTRDRIATMALDDYIAINEALTQRLLAAASLESVRRVVTVSSGAAVWPDDALLAPREDNPYGWLKRRAEVALASLAAERGLSAAVARAWSVSGAFVGEPSHYALADMVTQAIAGHVHVNASAPVYRRYTSVEDLLAVALASATEPGFTVIDSGGPLLEMGELAEAVVRVVNPHAGITRSPATGDAPHRYYADGTSWDDACSRAAFTPSGIEDQIAVTHAGVLARSRGC